MFDRIFRTFENIWKIPELRQRVIFTLAMLAVYRIGAYIPTPGVNGTELSKFLHQNGGALIGFFLICFLEAPSLDLLFSH